ncbi:37S ribosomal protein subunit S8, mitochondrial [Smittium culicis]|uniref:37S ribosomal protein subunit S8, mitochondrial n=1 Tax=Smittium culicis TaxID=133412 RepID=A0A1R1X7D9_9FUNG|nr:37S ribosomal protein subunit S8, mitochondrial [Smittium culicis]OMJ10545.1 37S ribosomal protein subunit S8, mitochondrial [Smittium culicis]OMJ17755.1 37S ribosomal protein subunit S8, mitochondrial [Smittium culicis]OMJ18694.1 37S ribosomal protein subunit S8, mitochondrial [Smittium culicis]
MVGVYDLCARVQNGFRAKIARIAVPETNLNLSVSRILYQQGFIYSVTRGNHLGPDPSYTPTTNLNIAERRLWLNLKYYNDSPVLTKMSCISKPSRKITCSADEIIKIVSGVRAGIVKPLNPGEVIIVSTSRGILEINDAAKQNLGGILLARVS